MKNCKFLIGFLLFLFFVSCKSNKVEDKKINKLANYTVVELSEKTDYLNSVIKYPKFDDYALLNKFVQNSVENYFNSFNKYAKSDWEELRKV